jgi:hypothetical protein
VHLTAGLGLQKACKEQKEMIQVKGNVGMPQYDILYRFALDCAEHKIRNNCDFQCKQCASNVSLYSIAREEAVMLQHSAELEMDHRFKIQHEDRMRELEYTDRKNAEGRGLAVYILAQLIIICTIVATVVIICSLKDKPKNTAPARTDYIISTLQKVRSIDTDGSGAIDCIDYALQFYDLYPDKSAVRIIWNKNKPVGMNHLFVTVDGIPIEPAVFANPKEGFFRMDSYYGNQYNPAFNRDVTAGIDLIKTDSYRWVW